MKIPKYSKKRKSGVKLGPSFLVEGDKKMMWMTRPIDSFLFEIDQIKSLLSNDSLDEGSSLFDHIVNQVLNDLVAAVLLFFSNRLHLMTGEKTYFTSIPRVDNFLLKQYDRNLVSVVGKKGYKQIDSLDIERGKKQHRNDRYMNVVKHPSKNEYIRGVKVGKIYVSSKEDLKCLVQKIQDIVHGAERSLDNIQKIHQVTEETKGNTTTFTTKALNHSYDLEKGAVNIKKTTDKDELD